MPKVPFGDTRATPGQCSVAAARQDPPYTLEIDGWSSSIPGASSARIGERDTFRVPTGRGDEFAHGSPGSPDSRERTTMGVKAREIYIPDLHIDTLTVKSRNFQ